jgi:hypothetical protein
MGPLGCQVEKNPTRKQVAEEKAAIHASKSAPPPNPTPAINDAALVLETCGRPASDTVVPIYDKLHNGPVRRMVYQGRQLVELEFIPASPVARQTNVEAPFPPGERAPAIAPPDTIWRFQSAHMENREFVTTSRLEIYLPCAAHAMEKEL